MKAKTKKMFKLIWQKIPIINFFAPNEKSLRRIPFSYWFFQKILGFNRRAYWPVHFTSRVGNPQNILIGKGSRPGFSPGCYIQGIGKIKIGKYVFIAPNVGIISANHSIYDLRKHNLSSIEIRDYCWIGMNSVILPGVKLGPHVVVAANSVVRDSFEEGYCIIAGNPARKVKDIDKGKVVDFDYPQERIGYIKYEKFESFRAKKLKI